MVPAAARRQRQPQSESARAGRAPAAASAGKRAAQQGAGEVGEVAARSSRSNPVATPGAKPVRKRAVRSTATAGTGTTAGKPARRVRREVPDLPDELEDMVEDADIPAPDHDGMHRMDGTATTPPKPTRRNLDPAQLYRGHARMALLRDIAMGEWSDAQIAASVGVPTAIISDFRESYPEEIAEVRAALAGQLAIESAGLWISKKQNRLAELQEDFEDIRVIIDLMRENTKVHLNLTKILDGSDTIAKGDQFDANMLLGSRRHQNLLRSQIAILKAVADELTPSKGQPAERTEGDNTVRYVIESDGTADGEDIIGALT